MDAKVIKEYGTIWSQIRYALKDLDEAYMMRLYNRDALENMFKAVWNLEQATAAMRKALEETKHRGG